MFNKLLLWNDFFNDNLLFGYVGKVCDCEVCSRGLKREDIIISNVCVIIIFVLSINGIFFY